MWLLILISVLYSLHFVAAENCEFCREQLLTNLRLALTFDLSDTSTQIYLVTAISVFGVNETTACVLPVLTRGWQEDISPSSEVTYGGKKLTAG